MNFIYYDLYFTVLRNRDENRDIDNQYENDESDYINFNDIVPNHHNRIKKNNEIMKERKMGSYINQFKYILFYKQR